MRVYLDNCCYNRPFDEQGELRVVVETIDEIAAQARVVGARQRRERMGV